MTGHDELEIDLDFGGMSGSELEQGGICRLPGWYRCVVEDVARKKPEAMSLVFKITEGPRKGEKIYQNLYIPGYSNDPKKDEGSLKKMGVWAQRLGLWNGEPSGMTRVAWQEAIGKDVVIEMVKGRILDKDTGNWKDKDTPEPAYAGVYPLDHEKIPDEVRKTLRLPPARMKPRVADAPGQKHMTVSEQDTRPLAGSGRPRVDLSDL